MKEIFAIIVTYNGMQWIKHCIESLMESTVPMQIIVIDNNSMMERSSLLKKLFLSNHISHEQEPRIWASK